MYLAIKSTLWKAGPASVGTLPCHSTRGSLRVLTAFSGPQLAVASCSIALPIFTWDLSMDMEHFCTLQEIEILFLLGIDYQPLG